MRPLLLSFAFVAVLAACKQPRAAQADAGSPPAKVLQFIEDDYPAALAQARAKSLPLFVDVWAPW